MNLGLRVMSLNINSGTPVVARPIWFILTVSPLFIQLGKRIYFSLSYLVYKFTNKYPFLSLYSPTT